LAKDFRHPDPEHAMIFVILTQSQKIFVILTRSGRILPLRVRMTDRIEREVWPRARARQWVLTFPNQLRSWLLRSPELFNEVITVVVDSISFHYEQHPARVPDTENVTLSRLKSLI